jgi:hypothetical protein
LLEERKDNPCTPEEQCGEMHIPCILDGDFLQCRCGLKRQPNNSKEQPNAQAIA